MIITKIKLENWRNFSRVDTDCGRRVFLLGPNASGKSNFLDAIRFFKDLARHGLNKAVMDRGGMQSIRYVGARTRPNITVAVSLDEGWEYSLSFGGRKDSVKVARETVKDARGRILLDRPDADDKNDPPRLRQTALEQINANKDFRAVADFFAGIQYLHILPQLVREPKAISPGPIDNDPFGRDLVYTIWKTPERVRASRLRRINKALKAAVPNFRELRVVQDANGAPHFRVTYEHWRNSGAYQDESSFSDGTLRLLALLWSLADAGGPLLLEEPELSLHEEIVARLPGLFSQVDTKRKKAGRQIFVTTHANALLRDQGIGPREILVLAPGKNGVTVGPPDEEETLLLEKGGLTAADVILPKTRPANIGRLRRF